MTPPVRTSAAALAAALVLVLLVGIAETVLGANLALWTLAMPAVALAAWYGSVPRAALVAVVSAATWVGAAAIADPIDLRTPLWYLDVGVRLAVLLLVGALAAGWRRAVVAHQENLRTDPVTGLVNAREFFGLVDAELRRALRYERPFTVIYVCVDGLAAAVQRQGRGAGDLVLRALGEGITASLRGPDTVARLRPAEFGILLPETGAGAAQGTLRRLAEVLTVEAATRDLAVTVSIGAVTWIRSEITVDQLLQRTYQMMYAAQRGEAGGCRHEVLDTADVIL